MAASYIHEQRLAFGRVADLYDRARPSYPDAVIDELIDAAALQPGSRVLEVGAGTGKATEQLAERGLAVLALEPDAAMAALARRRCASHPLVEISQLAFEDWRGHERVHAVASAQAWHWIAPDVRYARAGEALAPGGTLAAIWMLPRWHTTELRDRLRDAYRKAAPELNPAFPMHPGSDPTDLAGDWHAEICASEDFSGPRVLLHESSPRYATADYVALLETHQDHILLEPHSREALLEAVSEVIDEAGGVIEIDFVTRLCLARRV
jgi:SAM-dependent methyltransferase